MEPRVMVNICSIGEGMGEKDSLDRSFITLDDIKYLYM